LARGIGILGGTFDPVHYGHLRAAAELAAALDLAEVKLIPAGDPPHRSAPIAAAQHRLAMLDLAVQAFPGLTVDAREIARPGKSYTVLTLAELRAQAPSTPLLLILGEDAFRWLPTWHQWRRLFDLAHIVVVARPGQVASPDLPAGLPPELAGEWESRFALERERLESAPAGVIFRQSITPQPISSTAIREALALGREGSGTARGLLPPAVLAYIDHHRLYRPRA
jgi:nicotinate-nucleotide adenylyltransferase